MKTKTNFKDAIACVDNLRRVLDGTACPELSDVERFRMAQLQLICVMGRLDMLGHGRASAVRELARPSIN